MRSIILPFVALSGSLFASYAVLADDRIEVPLPIPHVSHDHDGDRDVDRNVEHRSPGCETKTVHRENDQGESKTVESHRCD